MSINPSPFQTFVDLLYAARQNQPYTLLLGSGLNFTPALLQAQATDHISLSKFYKYLDEISQEERTTLLQRHFATLQLHEGYKYLAQLIQAGYFRAVFTTNVDTFLEDALNEAQHKSKHANLIVRGTHTDEHIINSLQHHTSKQSIVCLLRGHISSQYYVKLSEIVNFPAPLESVVKNYLSGGMVLSGFITNADQDILRCIPKLGGFTWYISPNKKKKIPLPFDHHNSKVIRGDDADFNRFFRTLSEALHARQREEKAHASDEQPQEFPPLLLPSNQLLQKDQLPMNKQDQQRDFFVSYNSRDRQWAEWIAWQLEQAGYSVFIQAWDFLPGGNFVLDMQQAASQSKRTIAVLSEDYLKAPFPQSEWAAAFVQDPTGEHQTLLPVRVRECEPTGILKAIGYINLVGFNEADARTRLLNKVKQQRNKPDASPAFPGQTGVAHNFLQSEHELLPNWLPTALM